MRVRRVEILRSPGIASGFTVEGFGDRLTIVEGRNESGKSTLANAIRALLWPARSPTLRARGVFEAGNAEFRSYVEIHGGGWAGDEPTLPDSSAGRGMIVGISDLWHADEHDEAVRHAMTRELQGGYDISALHDAARPTSPTKPASEARKAEDSLHKARTAASDLMAKEMTLPDLRARAERNRAQAGRRSRIEAALKRRGLVERLNAQRNELRQIPDGALRVVEGEDARLESMRQAIDDAQASADRERKAAAIARANRATLNLPEHGVPMGDLALLTTLSNELATVVIQIQDAERITAGKQAEADTLAFDPRPFDTEALDRLDKALHDAQEAREQRRKHAQDADDWTPTVANPPKRTLPIATIVAAALSALAAAVTSAWMALGFAILTAVLAIATMMRKPTTAPDPLPQLRDRAEKSEKRYQAALQAVREIAGDDDELGSTLSLVTAAKRAERQDKFLRDLHGSKANLESLKAQRADLLARAAAALEPYTTEACASPDHVIRLRTDLEDRARQHKDYSKDEAKAQADASEDEKRRDKARDNYGNALKALGLTEDRLPELSEWMRYREPAQRLASQVRENEALLKSLDESLANDKDLLELDRPALEAKLVDCDAAGTTADELQKNIGGIEREISNAKASADVGEALADLERAARAVADARGHECAKAARRLVLDHAVAGMERDDMPALVRHADRLLARFTANAYGLRIGDRSEPVVYDLRAGAAKGYEQLSTGTRAQALLAMRLTSAFEAERRSGSTMLPLVLDEPLATTDDQRFEAIARAVFELAKEGRQLIYLTCEPAHAHRLEHMANEHGVPCVRKDLDAIRGRESTERNPAHVLAEPKPVPTPWTVSREDYLTWRGVEPLDPWTSTDAIDLYHVLPEHLETLHELTRRGITTVGQLTNLREDGPSQFLEFVLAAQVARQLIMAWRKGRARPITKPDLAESFVGKSTYFAQVAEINDEVGGSASELLHALESGRVKGFGPNKAEQFRDWLIGQSLLPTTSPESRAEVIGQALNGVIMGISDQSHGFLLATANRLLDQFDAPNLPQDEAPAGSRA